MSLSSFLYSLAGAGVLLPYYHMVSNEPVPHIRRLYRCKDEKAFERDLEALLADFQPVSLGDVLDAHRGLRRLPGRAFHLSFDDGFAEMESVVSPLLRRRGVPATFFVCSAFIGNGRLSRDAKASLLAQAFDGAGKAGRAEVFRRLRRHGPFEGSVLDAPETFVRGLLALPPEAEPLLDALQPVLGVDFAAYLRERRPYLDSASLERLSAQGFSLGAHSVDHPRYDGLTRGEQLRQTYESLEFLAPFRLGYGVFAFPYSDRGVDASFFLETKASGLLDLSFGTGGPARSPFGWHFQRLSFEKPPVAARRILRSAAVRGLARRLLKPPRTRLP